MDTRYYDAVIIGGGPAGLAAAIAAKKAGIDKVVVLEQQDFLGGVLPQCIHDGFGLHIFGKNMTGSEYAAYYRNELTKLNIEYHLSTTVLDINDQKEVICAGKILGAAVIKAEAVILAMGCKERTRGMLRIPGTRPAGVYTAGAAQHMMNIQNYLPGKSIVILGLGDIGLIMARRLTLEGVKVRLVLGLEASGLQRNMVQCIYDFAIPLKLGYTVTSLHGIKRLKGVTIARIGNDGNVLEKSREYVYCDTLLLAAGLVPETEITDQTGLKKDSLGGGIIIDEAGQTNIEGIFACGNVVNVHDLVDFVTLEGEKTGLSAAAYINRNKGQVSSQTYKLPSIRVSGEPKGNPDLPRDQENIRYRICILCPKGCLIKGEFNSNWIISGHKCARGREYGLQEMIKPLRLVTTTVKVKGYNHMLLPVKTDRVVAKDKIPDIIKCCSKITLDKPIDIGDIVIANVAGTGVNVVACDALK